MKTARLAALAFAAGLTACAGARPAPSGCQVEFLFKAPDRPFERLGTFDEMVRVVPPGGAHEALRPAACALGADAVVVTKSLVVNLLDHTNVQGYAIRWKAAPPAVPPPSPEPAPAAAPSESPPPAPAPEKPLQL